MLAPVRRAGRSASRAGSGGGGALLRGPGAVQRLLLCHRRARVPRLGPRRFCAGRPEQGGRVGGARGFSPRAALQRRCDLAARAWRCGSARARRAGQGRSEEAVDGARGVFRLLRGDAGLCGGGHDGVVPQDAAREARGARHVCGRRDDSAGGRSVGLGPRQRILVPVRVGHERDADGGGDAVPRAVLPRDLLLEGSLLDPPPARRVGRPLRARPRLCHKRGRAVHGHCLRAVRDLAGRASVARAPTGARRHPTLQQDAEERDGLEQIAEQLAEIHLRSAPGSLCQLAYALPAPNIDETTHRPKERVYDALSEAFYNPNALADMSIVCATSDRVGSTDSSPLASPTPALMPYSAVLALQSQQQMVSCVLRTFFSQSFAETSWSAPLRSSTLTPSCCVDAHSCMRASQVLVPAAFTRHDQLRRLPTLGFGKPPAVSGLGQELGWRVGAAPTPFLIPAPLDHNAPKLCRRKRVSFPLTRSCRCLSPDGDPACALDLGAALGAAAAAVETALPARKAHDEPRQSLRAGRRRPDHAQRQGRVVGLR
eukprot:2611991-Rhodomonas_salina.1